MFLIKSSFWDNAGVGHQLQCSGLWGQTKDGQMFIFQAENMKIEDDMD